MAKNDIRLRRNMMSTGRIARHRNYSELMRQHDQGVKLKRVLKVFTYFLIILIVTVLLIIVIRWENRKKNNVDLFDPTGKIEIQLSRNFNQTHKKSHDNAWLNTQKRSS